MQMKPYETMNGIFGDGPAMMSGIQDTARESTIKRNAGLDSSREDDLLTRQLAAYQRSGTGYVGYARYGDYQIAPMNGKFHIVGQGVDTSFRDPGKAVQYLRELMGQTNLPKSEDQNFLQKINQAVNPNQKNLWDWFFDPINGLLNSPLTMTREAENAMQQAVKEGKGFGEQLLEMIKAYPRGFLKSINGDYVEMGDYLFGFPLLKDLTSKWEDSGPIGNVTHDTLKSLINFFGPDILGKLTKVSKISDIDSLTNSEAYESFKEILDLINTAKDIKDEATDIEKQLVPTD